MKITIRVEQRHIDCGKKKRCTICPVALALREAGIKHPSVDGITVAYRFTKEPIFVLSDKVNGWIKRFDMGLEVQPFEFTADIPERFLTHK